MGTIWLRTVLGETPLTKTIDIRYIIVDCISPYNIILGRPALNTFGAIVSTLHLCVKFPVQDELIATVHADHKEARQCYHTSLKQQELNKAIPARVQAVYSSDDPPPLNKLDPREEFRERPQALDELEKVTFYGSTNKFTYIGNALSGKEKARLIKLLRDNTDLFAWTPIDMPGINPSIICHKLVVDPTVKPMAQKKLNLGEERRQASLEETKKLLSAGFIKEVRFTTWLSNVVMVKKNTGKWRMCVDFTNLNKACPKDAYPLPCIDKLVDSASGFNCLSFMDAYSGYNQILMHPEDQHKTAFITEFGNYCYTVMPFGLKNAGATYQRLMDKMFRNQIGRNIEVYVDDMVAKTSQGNSHCDDLTEVFGQIRAYNMRLNPEKCTFGIQGGKFLGFMLTSKGIEANPEKCAAILDMTSPKTVKEVQKLTGRIAALSRFLPAIADRSFHFFQAISKHKQFTWTNACEESFRKLKAMLMSPQILQSPEEGKPLYLYLSVSNHAISSALVLETGKTQKPVYFVSKVLQPTEQRYPMVEQLALALITTSRRLRHYFQSHTIIVRTDQPLRQILAKPEVAGRLIKWSIELSEFDIQYQPRPALKSQILVDFIAEFTCPHNTAGPSTGMMYVDGASNNEGSGARIILEYEDTIIEQSVRFSFEANNNQAEYEALLAGLNLAIKLQIPRIVVHCDSLLIVQQVNGSFQVKDPLLERYWNMVRKLILTFDKFKIIHVPRGNNQRADILSKLATSRKGTSPKLSQLTLEEPSVNLTYILSMSQELDWRVPIIDYLLHGTIPTSETNPKLFRRQASFYVLVGAELYKRGFSQPLLKCLSKKESAEAMDEVHEGVCGNHIGGRSLAAKLLRAGYYWPTIRKDCINKVKKCDHCQKHATIMHSPAEVLHSTEVTWPFFRWGMDILGPFSTAPGQVMSG
ncbi:uncharacterized protein [Arachis hypogaea]|uniref:uncharacterized protein n=1 Tax=Arachis hypogaea TaxID=3818 RepID=UPI000DED0DD5|nr:uncharacterized protein LOC112794995 [Arachis hypogaea]